MKYQEIEGDLISLSLRGMFDVIVHGCNCKSKMGAGIAVSMAKTFDCDKFEMESWGPTIEKLGNIDYQTFVLGELTIWSLWDAKNNKNESELTVVNAYTQYNYGRNHVDGDEIPLSYEALTLCMKKINHIFKGKHIGLPLIGCGLARGVFDKEKEEGLLYHGYIDVKTIIQEELKDCDVTIVKYKNI